MSINKKYKISMFLVIILLLNLICPTIGVKVNAQELLNNEIKVRVEGTNKTLFNEDFKITKEEVVKDVIENSIGKDNIKGLNSNFITEVLGESQKSDIGWMYYLVDANDNIRQGDIVNVEKIKDNNGQYYKELVLYMAKWSNGITCSPKVTYKNDKNKYTLKITEQNVMMGIDERNASDVNVKVDGVGEYKTNEHGEVTFKIKAGENKVHIYKDLKDSKGIQYPAIVRQTFTLMGENIAIDNDVVTVLDKLTNKYEGQDINYKKLLALNHYNEVKRTSFILEENTNAANCASNIMGIIALNKNPYDYEKTNYVEKLLNFQDKDGEFVVGENDKGSSTILATCITALDMAKADYKKNLAVNTLMNQVSEIKIKNADIDTITSTMIALSKHREVEGVNEIITLLIQELKARQLEGGGFDYYESKNSSYSTAPVIQALIAVGEDINSDKWTKGRNPIEALLACKLEDDSFDIMEGMDEGDEGATELAFSALVDAYKEKSVYNEFVFIKEEPKNYGKIIENEIKDIISYFENVKDLDYNAVLGLTSLKYDKDKINKKLKLKDKDNAFNLAQDIMSIIAIEENPQSYNGKNYVDLLYKKLENGKVKGKSIYGLIALETACAKKEYINNIISKVKTEFNNNKIKKIGDKARLVIALSPYKEDNEIKSIINQCIEDLKIEQLENGAFAMDKRFAHGESEDTALAIEAIIASGGNPLSEEWTKNGKNPLDVLLSFKMGKGYIYESSLGAYEQDMYTGYVLRSLMALKNKEVIFNEFKLDNDNFEDDINKLIIVNNIKNETFIKGNEVDIALKLNNKNSKLNESVTIVVGIYNENNKLVEHKILKEYLNGGEIKDIKESVSLPNKNNLTAKIFVWDSLEEMNSKTEPIIVKVK